MNEEKRTIPVRCLFCLSNKFFLPTSKYKLKSGDMIRCGNCGRYNEYDSLMRVVKKKALNIAKEIAERIMDKFTKDINKMFK